MPLTAEQKREKRKQEAEDKAAASAVAGVVPRPEGRAPKDPTRYPDLKPGVSAMAIEFDPFFWNTPLACQQVFAPVDSDACIGAVATSVSTCEHVIARRALHSPCQAHQSQLRVVSEQSWAPHTLRSERIRR